MILGGRLALALAVACCLSGGYSFLPTVSLLSKTRSRVPRLAMATILVGQTTEGPELRRLADSLGASNQVHLAKTFRDGGLSAVEEALAAADKDAVVTVSGPAVEDPGVRKLVGSEKVTVHCVRREDLDGDESCAIKESEAHTRYTLVVGDDHDAAAAELQRLVGLARVTSHPAPEDVRLNMGSNTFFLSLTFGNMKDYAKLIPELCKGVDAMELRVDLLESQDPYFVLEQMALLRKLTNNMPIIFTIRSKGQCGAFPDDPEALFHLARWGLRGGAEYMDIESNWPRWYRNDLIKEAKALYPSAVLIGSYHVVNKQSSVREIKRLFKRCYHNGHVDAVKVVTTATEHEDSYRVHQAAEELALPVPYIGLCLREIGQLSRVLNMRYTPVTHEKLPSVAAPGQLSSSTIMRLRKDLGIVQPRKFYLLGHPISESPSPDMHNAGFQASSLPHHYSLSESEDVAVSAKVLEQADFGGASVTIPHKQTIMEYLDTIGEGAEVIGAVNTVVVDIDPKTGARSLRGENTDWLGIMRPIQQRLLEQGKEGSKGMAALIVGAGGAAMGGMYAMQQLGMTLLVYNRSQEKAESLAARFGGTALGALTTEAVETACGKPCPDVIISTIPGSAEFTVPEGMLSAKPIVFDAAYKPPRTALLEQAVASGCPLVQGADMLIEQGREQFQMWTYRRAPGEEMAAAVYSRVEKI
ncbi:unnamed protein product [Chrysoparadoxa australica]